MRPLKIVLTADPELCVPPKLYGGIERIVDMLGRELVERGHDVTVLARAGSEPAGRLVPWPGGSSRSALDTLRNAATLARVVAATRPDLVHSFSRLAYMAPILPLGLPKLMTYQRKVTRKVVQFGDSLSRGTLWFSAISRWMMQDTEAIGTWRFVPNGVSLSTYTFRDDPGPDAPLVFLGRLEKDKGPHLAIEVARRTGVPLVLAGNVPDEHRGWFEAHVQPHLDGSSVSYVGPVDDRQKNDLLGRARAFLMPITWDEPFGIVMAEAMACGAPVLGLRRGAVPEVVEDGRTGFVSDDLDGLVAAVARIANLHRAACRERVERLYSEAAVADGYLAAYADMLAASAAPRA